LARPGFAQANHPLAELAAFVSANQEQQIQEQQIQEQQINDKG
jgi:hypothetical protein